MKLILSSCDFRNEKSKKTILNNLSKPVDQCKLLFIPNEKATYETIHSEKYFLRMQEFGFARDNISVFDYYNEQQFINLDLDVIYISGGNTFATLKRIKDCGFDKEIIRYVRSGVLYIGGQKVILIAGGYDKHIPYEPLAPEVVAHVKELVLMGATGPRIEKAVREDPNFNEAELPIQHADNMQHAVELARACAKPGDIIILSPASASFDLYPNFEVRGREFKKIVNELK